jgi:phosphoglycerate dehydrogenase-like enzyme
MYKVVFINGQREWVAQVLQEKAPSADFEVAWVARKAPDEEKVPLLRDADFLVLHPAEISADLLRASGNLKLIQLLTAGYDKVPLDVAAELGVPVATNGGANSWAVAEHAVALLLSLYKRLTQCDRSVREGRWREPVTGFNTFEAAGKTLGLIGAGNIGRKVARRLAAFECNVVYTDIVAAPDIEEDLGARRVSREELFAEADIISLHVPATKETYKLINKESLALMKPGTVILNTSRGAAIDEEALVEALRENRILGAGLDVFDQEPIPSDHPFLQLDNVVLSPHTGGHSYEGWFRRAEFAWQNIVRVTGGEPLQSLVPAPAPR